MIHLPRRIVRGAYWRCRQVIERRRHKARLRRFYAPFVRPGDLVFDVGANVGDRVAAFLSLGARVVAIEPQSSCVAKLRRLRLPNLTVVPAACGAEPGTGELHVGDADVISTMSDEFMSRTRASGRFGDRGWNRTETVPVTTLDALISEYGRPSFLKVDVEGFEPQVYAGLSQAVPVTSFEFTSELTENSFACIQRLGTLGPVECNLSLGESGTFSWPGWVSADEAARRLRAFDPKCLAWGDMFVRAL